MGASKVTSSTPTMPSGWSRSRLPPYDDWRRRLAPPARRLPAGGGVWVATGEAVSPLPGTRPGVGEPPAALRRLCQALRGGEDVVEALAFPVRARGEGK